jgi:hypothetical protein
MKNYPSLSRIQNSMARNFQLKPGSVIRNLAATLLLLFSCGLVQAQSLVCRLPSIAGFDRAAAKAKKCLKPNTTSVAQTTVFITVENEQLYLHSNYVTRGFKNPTKIATGETNMDLANLAYNLIGTEDSGGMTARAFMQSFNEMTFIVDQRLFTHARYKHLDFNNARNVKIIGADGVIRPTRQMRLSNGDVHRFVKHDKLYVRATEPNASKVVKSFAAKPFRQSDVRVISMVTDHATNNKMAELIPEANRVSFNWSAANELETIMAANQKRTLIFVGHVENDSYVVLDSSNRPLLTVSLRHLESMAKRHDITLYALGCNSGGNAPVGPIDVFNTVEVVQGISAALQTSVTHFQFVNRLSSPDLPLVIDDAIFERAGAAEYAHFVQAGNRLRLAITVYQSNDSLDTVTSGSRTVGSILVSAPELGRGDAPVSTVQRTRRGGRRPRATRGH